MFYKIIANGYISTIGTGNGGEEITEAQYNEILAMLRNPPAAPEGWAYRLTEDLQWELEELPPVDEDPEISAEEALAIILGGNNA